MSPFRSREQSINTLELLGIKDRDLLGRSLDVALSESEVLGVTLLDQAPQEAEREWRRADWAGFDGWGDLPDWDESDATPRLDALVAGPWIACQSEGAENNPRQRPIAGMLDAFLAIRVGDGRDVERFIRRWGAFYVCPHLIPGGHGGCTPALYRDGRIWTAYEPAWAYWQFSQLFSGLIAVAAFALGGARLTTHDWEFVHRFRSDEATPHPTKADAAKMVERWLQDLLQTEPVEIRFAWQEQPRFGLAGSFFGILTYQLVTAITGVLFAICSHCRRSYAPRRKPQSGRDNYCPSCRDVRKAAYKRRRRGG